MGERQRGRSEREDTVVGERKREREREKETGVFERERIQMREKERERGMGERQSDRSVRETGMRER